VISPTITVRCVLRQLLPPIVVDAIRYVRGDTATVPAVPAKAVEVAVVGGSSAADTVIEWEAVPNTDRTWTSNAGWSHESIVTAQLRKWPSFLKSMEGTFPLGQSHEGPGGMPANVAAHNTIVTFGYALGRVAQGRSAVSILDWGGGLGHYYVYARALFPDLVLNYVVKDLPGLCGAGASLLPEVTFVSDESEALSQSYDFVFASSSVHYTRDHYHLLERLCGCASNWLMITRTPFVEKADDFVVVQRPYMYGYMTEYPGWFMNRTKMLDFVSGCGFGLIRQFIVAEQPNVPNAPEPAQYFGFLFRRLN
jgi:putative methyltransferase (TIGR04325 family)